MISNLVIILIKFDCFLKEDVFGSNTYGYVVDFLWPEEEILGRWWRSDESICSEYPYSGFEFRREWPLKEALTMHFVRLQQESHQSDINFPD